MVAAKDLVPVLKVTKTDAAYHAIRRQLLTGVIAPGSKVDQEALAAELGLSTTPVREALRRLDAAGLITLAAHREAWVSPLTSAADGAVRGPAVARPAGGGQRLRPHRELRPCRPARARGADGT